MIHLLFVEHIQNAFQSLRATRLRTLLTTVGVAIGVASVTTILALSGGVSTIVTDQVTNLGGNIAVVRPGAPAATDASLTDSINQQSYATSTLSEQDVASIAAIPGVKAAAPMMLMDSTLKTSGGNSAGGFILATTPAFESITKLPIQDGQFIDSVTDQDTAVIGKQLSIDLFGTDTPIGQTFSVRGHSFTIIGVMKPTNNPINYNMVNFDNTAIINLASGKTLHKDIPQIQQINIQADEASQLAGIIATATKQLKANHQDEQDFTILSGDEIALPTSQLFSTIARVMTIIAAISLIVGGIGIMNIMLVSVAERTREIGLRKSVGASNGDIVWQFMVEALIMSLIGGAIGYVIGYVVAFAVSTSLPFDPLFNWHIAAVALAMSTVVGGIFGLYPAVKAARKDPIESLRQYH